MIFSFCFHLSSDTFQHLHICSILCSDLDLRAVHSLVSVDLGDPEGKATVRPVSLRIA